MAQGAVLTSAKKSLTVKAGEALKFDFFIKFPKKILQFGHGKAFLNAKSKENQKFELSLVGPFQ